MDTEHVIPEEHVVPPRVYVGIFTILMLLTVLTVAAAFMDFGFLSVAIAVTIAVVKATFVVLYFMHLRYSSKLTQVIFTSGVLWLIILLVLTFQDYMTRGWDLR